MPKSTAAVDGRIRQPRFANHIGHARHYSDPSFTFGTAGRNLPQPSFQTSPTSAARCLPFSVAHAAATSPDLQVSL